MKKFTKTAVLLLSLSLVTVWGQTKGKSTEKSTEAMSEKAQALIKEAKAGSEGSKKSLQDLQDELKRAESSNLPPKERAALADLIKEAEKPGADAADMAQQFQDMVKNASPGAQKILQNSASKSASTSTDGPKTAKASASAPRSFAAVEPPAPKLIKAQAPKEKKSAPNALVIDADRLYMDQDSRIAIFKGNVRLRSATLDADCEELEIIFKEGAFADMGVTDKSDKPEAAEKDKEKAAEKDKEKSKEATTDEEKIEKVWFKGNGRIITIVRRDPNGDATCKSKQAIYDAVSGTLLLKEFPEAERTGKRLVGNTVASTITITKDMKITGVGTRAVFDTSKPSEKKSPN